MRAAFSKVSNMTAAQRSLLADAFYYPDLLAPEWMPSSWDGFLPDVAGLDADFFVHADFSAFACERQGAESRTERML
jgi:hypothetical protein